MHAHAHTRPPRLKACCSLRNLACDNANSLRPCERKRGKLQASNRRIVRPLGSQLAAESPTKAARPDRSEPVDSSSFTPQGCCRHYTMSQTGSSTLTCIEDLVGLISLIHSSCAHCLSIALLPLSCMFNEWQVRPSCAKKPPLFARPCSATL